MRTDGPVKKPAPTAHVHGPHCAHCGTTLLGAREYALEDHFMRLLFLAVCAQMGVEAVKTRQRAAFRVEAAVATLDQLEVRVQSLIVELDGQLMNVAARFIRERTGQEIDRSAR
ncbi:MAG: hypothetical protein IT374_04280 [Polyangiaceae bacterium]|nr:hypothetical protein [Polyangiaceae bacterium]